MTSPTTKLKRVVSLQAGGTPSVTDRRFWAEGGEGIPWVSIGDMSDGTVVTTTTRELTEKGISDRRLKPGSPGTLLLAMYASVGAVAELGVQAVWNQAILGIRAHHGLAVQRFVRYWLEHLRPTLTALVRSNTQDNLNAEQVGNLPFPTLQPDEQRAIADFLDTETARIDALIAKKRRLIDALRERRQATIAEALASASTVTVGARFRHVVKSAIQGWSPQCHSRPADGVNTWAVLKAGAANGGSFRPGENKEFPDDQDPRPDVVVRPGRLIISRANTRELVGSAAVVDAEFPRLMLSDKLYAFTLDERRALPDFVSFTLGTRKWRDLIELEASGSSPSMQNISYEDIVNLPMDLPSARDQRTILMDLQQRLSRFDRLIRGTEETIKLAAERRQALITAAVTGELEVAGVAA